MKSKRRGLALAAMLLSANGLAFADTGTVGDLPSFGEEAYFHEDAAYAETIAGATQLEIPFQRRDVTRRRCRADPVIKGHQVHGLRAATRVACHSKRFGSIHFRPAHQVVRRADTVPRLVSDRGTADEDSVDVVQLVLQSGIA